MRQFLCFLLMLAAGLGTVDAAVQKSDVDWSLYLVAWRKGKSIEWLKDTIEKAVQGGVTVVQLDEPDLSNDQFTQLAIEVKQLLSSYHVPLIINRNIDVAKASQADGLHLLKADRKSIDQAREILGPKAIIGISARCIDDILLRPAVDYMSLCPVFPSTTHPEIKPFGIEGLKTARKYCRVPLLAVGGVRLENAAEVTSAGANGIVVVSAIMKAADPKKAARELRLALDKGR